MERTTSAQPVDERERIRALDALRGGALLGILMVNMAAFKGLSTLEQFPRPESLRATTDQIAYFVIQAFFTGKFYPIFALLFGLGFALQIQRLEARGIAPTTIMLRRLIVLLIIGALHGLFIWTGDVLFGYALCGLILLAVRGLSPNALLTAVLALWGLQFVCCLSCAGVAVWAAQLGEFQQEGSSDLFAAYVEQARQAYAQPNYWQAQRFRFTEWALMQVNMLLMMPNILMMFLLGLYFGKVGLFGQLKEHRRLLLWLTFGALPLGLAINAYGGYGMLEAARTGDEWRSLGWMLVLLPLGAVLSLGYVGLFGLSWSALPGLQRVLVPVAHAGQMALTNYLMQSVVCTLLFYGYGLGLYGRVGIAQGMGLTVLIWLLQVGFSVLWLSRFQYGPMEWLWRSLTYGQRLPLRRPVRAA